MGRHDYLSAVLQTTVFHRLAAVLALVFSMGCGSTTSSAPSTVSAAAAPTAPSAPSAAMTDPDHKLQRGDKLRMEIQQPNQKFVSIEAIQDSGEIVTPDGSLIRAAGMTLAQFEEAVRQMFAGALGYEQSQFHATLVSCPYRVVRYTAQHDRTAGSVFPEAAEEHQKKAWSEDFWEDFHRQTNASATALAASVANSTNAVAVRKSRPALLLKRTFKAPISVWQAIRQEGGIPADVNPAKIHLLRDGTEQMNLDCSGKDGAPDGDKPVMSGDV
ncbi:MAG: hypothetical protein JO317_09375, partial [Verrucomicrobiae bacterium]|nr:hypothetical protein [Verrucomicrobiae bacterium]